VGRIEGGAEVGRGPRRRALSGVHGGGARGSPPSESALWSSYPLTHGVISMARMEESTPTVVGCLFLDRLCTPAVLPGCSPNPLLGRCDFCKGR